MGPVIKPPNRDVPPPPESDSPIKSKGSTAIPTPTSEAYPIVGGVRRPEKGYRPLSRTEMRILPPIAIG